MPRATRHFLPGYVWHITHHCHKREFLLQVEAVPRRFQLALPGLRAARAAVMSSARRPRTRLIAVA
jgi:REP element-mobilizing transposase RayT